MTDAGTLSPLDYARGYLAAGMSVIPIRPDGSKEPSLPSYNKYKGPNGQLPSPETVTSWWSDGRMGIALLCGVISGNREVIDFDKAGIFELWAEAVEIELPGLLARLPVVASPRPGGYHVHYRCSEIQGGQPLAMEPGVPKPKKRIETRGEGNYIIMPGSPLGCHEDRRPYRHVAGPPLTEAPFITPTQRQIFFRLCNSFDVCPNFQKPQGGLPGEDFNQRGPSWAAILEAHGWQHAGQRADGATLWRRPRKERGHSATTGFAHGKDGLDLFCVFSSNADPFPGPTGTSSCSSHDKFGAYTLLNHNGDFKAAAAELRRQGYGGPLPETNGHTANGDQRAPKLVAEVLVEAIVHCFLDIKPQPIHWLFEPWLLRRGVNLLDGDPGQGKSTMALGCAAAVSKGWGWPMGTGAASEPAGVLILSAEDDAASTIRPRLDAAGADCSRCFDLPAIREGKEERPPVLPWDLDVIGEVALARGVALIIIDPFMAYLDGKIDAHRDQDVRRALHRLKMLAEQTGAAILVIRHLNKLTSGAALYRGGGSIGILGAARSALLVGSDPANPERHVLAPNKCNLVRPPRARMYSIEGSGEACVIAWGEETDLTVNDILSQPGGSRKRQTAGEQAAEVLRELLSRGPCPAKEIEAEMYQRGFSERGISEGRKIAGVRSDREGFQGVCMWSLVNTDA